MFGGQLLKILHLCVGIMQHDAEFVPLLRRFTQQLPPEQAWITQHATRVTACSFPSQRAAHGQDIGIWKPDAAMFVQETSAEDITAKSCRHSFQNAADADELCEIRMG